MTFSYSVFLRKNKIKPHGVGGISRLIQSIVYTFLILCDVYRNGSIYMTQFLIFFLQLGSPHEKIAIDKELVKNII